MSAYPMSTTHDILRKRILANVTDFVPRSTALPNSFEDLNATQWSDKFESLMRARLRMGAFRYGPLKQQVPNGYDNIGSAIERLRLYQLTGNLEHLVDAANLALVEFVTGAHPLRHFKSVDDGIHTAKL